MNLVNILADENMISEQGSELFSNFEFDNSVYSLPKTYING